MTINIFNLILIIVLSALALWLTILQFKLHKFAKQYKEFFSGKNGKALEDVILNQGKLIKRMGSDIKELYNSENKLDKRVNLCIQKVGLVRYNPFRDSGGDISFSIALLDDKDTGLILTGLYARDKTNLFAKPVIKGKSEYHLTDEELEAIRKAEETKV